MIKSLHSRTPTTRFWGHARIKGAKGLNHEPYHNNMRNNGNSITSYWENGHDTQWDWYFKMRRGSGQAK